jgi:cell division protein FtsZ
VQEASSLVQKVAHEDANIIFGAVEDEKMKDAVKITVIATGFKDNRVRAVVRPSMPERLPTATRPVLSRGNGKGGNGEVPRLLPLAEGADLDTPAFLRRRLSSRH